MNGVQGAVEGGLGNVPSSLQARMQQELVSSVPELRNKADRLMAQVVAMEANRDAALTLLTADALVTLACELECQSKADR